MFISIGVTEPERVAAPARATGPQLPADPQQKKSCQKDGVRPLQTLAGSPGVPAVSTSAIGPKASDVGRCSKSALSGATAP